jgi:Fe-S cluster assembly scaffold protein SufB
MHPERLAAQIADSHSEPDQLREFRQQAATDLDPAIATQLDQVYTHHGGDRIDVSQTAWDRLQDRKNDTTTIQPLTEAVQDDPSVLESIPEPDTSIQRLCQAFFTNGVHIRIEDDEDTVIQPVLKGFARPEIDLIVVQAVEDVEATVIEGCSAPRSALFRAGTTCIDAVDADLRYGNLQHWQDTLLLDSTRTHGQTPVDHFLKAERAIIEADADSRVLTPETAFRTTNLHLTDTAATGGEPIEQTAESLTNLPDEYRTEIAHILGLGD